MTRPLGIIGVPTSAGEFAPGQELAPSALREAGLIDRLRDQGITVADYGDSPSWRWRPDPDHPRAQHLDVVAETARTTAERVARSAAEGEVTLVLGGGCTVGIGTVAGHLAHAERVGLIYLDMHPDLNVPPRSKPGALSWMGMAHMLGCDGAAPELAGIGPRTPLLTSDDVVFLAWEPDEATAVERATIDRFGLHAIDAATVARDPERAARSALERLAMHHDRIVVHFDVDVIDFNDVPLSENTGLNVGLTFDQAFGALRVLLRSDTLAGVTITELNPLHGAEDGSTLRRFVDALASALAGSPLLVDGRGAQARGG